MDDASLAPILTAMLGRALRRARKHRKLSQESTATKAGIDLDTLASLEAGHGTVRPFLATLQVLEYRVAEQDDDLALGPWLAQRRKMLGLSQQWLADQIGVSKPTIIQVERGQGHIRSFCMVVFALGLEIALRPDELTFEHMAVGKGIRTPLRYPGGKFRALRVIAPYLPRTIHEFREPFLGGGSVALHVTKHFPDSPIWVNDLYPPLVSFWTVLQDPARAREMITRLRILRIEHPDERSARELFLRVGPEMHDPGVDDLTRAVGFYVANRCSFSGLTQSGSFSPEASRDRWTIASIERLTEITPAIKNWRITNLDYRDVLGEPWSGSSPLLYLDPPYDISANRLYGLLGNAHRDFDHEQFRRVVEGVPARVMITYNSSKLLRMMYRGWQQVVFDHGYSMNSKVRYRRRQRDRRELLLRNYHVLTGAPLMRPAVV